LDEYRQVIQTCVRRLNGAGPIQSISRRIGLASNRPALEAARQLDLLDLRRLAMRAQEPTTTTAR
jgi:hypothetical protein